MLQHCKKHCNKPNNRQLITINKVTLRVAYCINDKRSFKNWSHTPKGNIICHRIKQVTLVHVSVFVKLQTCNEFCSCIRWFTVFLGEQQPTNKKHPSIRLIYLTIYFFHHLVCTSGRENGKMYFFSWMHSSLTSTQMTRKFFFRKWENVHHFSSCHY